MGHDLTFLALFSRVFGSFFQWGKPRGNRFFRESCLIFLVVPEANPGKDTVMIFYQWMFRRGLWHVMAKNDWNDDYFVSFCSAKNIGQLADLAG